MPGKIQFDREMRNIAKDKGNALFAVGCETARGKGMLHTPGLTSADADDLFAFCIRVASAGETPEHAFKAVYEEQP